MYVFLKILVNVVLLCYPKIVNIDKNTRFQTIIVETKGVHLSRSPDTKYKKSVFDVCNRYAKKLSADTLDLAMKDREIEY